MVYTDTKIYVQLQPTADEQEQLTKLQSLFKLPANARQVDVSELHMTVLHIGKVEKLITSLRPAVSLDVNSILELLNTLVEQLQQYANNTRFINFRLKPSGYDHFGVHKSTFVMTFETTPELQALHQKSLAALQTFLLACGIKNVDDFMMQDANLQFARSLRPHVTLAKSFTDKPRNTVPGPIKFKLMKLVY